MLCGGDYDDDGDFDINLSMVSVVMYDEFSYHCFLNTFKTNLY